ncbi:MAG: ribonuclease III [bacterium]|nr:ribonuclease III [bacterium]
MVSDHRREELRGLETTIGFEFKDIELLNQALTHRSYVYESEEDDVSQNERMEFLGDVVLSLSVSEYIYHTYPDYVEGELAKIRAVVVSKHILAQRARAINLGQYLLLGKGEEMTGGRDRDSIMVDAFEAVIGALFLDQGMEPANVFVLNQLKEEIEVVNRDEGMRDYKTILQEYSQNRFKALPHYEVVVVKGPDHRQTFEMSVSLKGELWGKGKGKSKKEAEQRAAYEAIRKLEEEDQETGGKK